MNYYQGFSKLSLENSLFIVLNTDDEGTFTCNSSFSLNSLEKNARGVSIKKKIKVSTTLGTNKPINHPSPIHKSAIILHTRSDKTPRPASISARYNNQKISVIKCRTNKPKTRVSNILNGSFICFILVKIKNIQMELKHYSLQKQLEYQELIEQLL
jgi:hypothetical protein